MKLGTQKTKFAMRVQGHSTQSAQLNEGNESLALGEAFAPDFLTTAGLAARKSYGLGKWS